MNHFLRNSYKMQKINRVGPIREHSKASERYVDVIFNYPEAVKFETSIPITYRRTGIEIQGDGVDPYLENVYKELAPDKIAEWISKQKNFWEQEKPGAAITKAFFDALSLDFKWHCAKCALPKNPNFARRIQELKEFGYTIATNINKQCHNCEERTTHHILVPIARGGITGYETWSPDLRIRIISLLKNFDAYEAKFGKKEGLLPDHKFPEIRWDAQTPRSNLENLTNLEITRDFQLLSNQRNQQKREVCRACSQTGKRGMIYGIPFFFSGSELWDSKIPQKGKAAEPGCIGCGWYDIQAWRDELLKRII